METRKLPCKLTDLELAAKSDEMAERVTDLRVEQDKKKEANSKANAAIKALEVDILNLAREITAKVELRDVEVKEMPNWNDRTMETVRMDSGDMISRRLLTQEEMQGHLKIVPMSQAADEAV